MRARTMIGWLLGAGLFSLLLVTGPVLARLGWQPSAGGGAAGLPPTGSVARRPSAVEAPIEALEFALKLDAGQKQTITAIQEQYRKERAALLTPPDGPGARPPGPEELQIAAAKAAALQQQAERQIAALLTPEQRRELAATLATVRSLRAVGIPPELYGALKLTTGQQRTIAAFGQEVLPAPSSQGQPGTAAPLRSPGELRQIRERSHAKAMAALTGDQRKLVQDYLKSHPQPALDELFAAAPPAAPGPARPPAGAPAGEAPAGGGAVAAAGRDLFQQRCQNCHGPQGRGGAAAPALTRAGARPEAQLRQTIRNGRGKMPAFGNQLGAAQIDSVIAYLRELGANR